MTHTPHKTSVLRAFTMAFLVVGIANLCATSTVLMGQLTGGGVTLLAYEGGNSPLSAVSLNDMQSAAPDLSQVTQMQWQMILGMLMILGGFLCHLLFIWKHKKSPLQQTALRTDLMMK